ncbi:MAG: 30S ribosomal protein S3 [Oscillospiraceae bacterium]|nr:30S ribosomal protein S3 [Oscillospiraceae bacterium]
MGQKVNPHGLRVGVIKDWDSRWFANKATYGDTLVEDYKIRKFIKNSLKAAGVPKIEIERYSDKVRINVHCAKPGIVIGKGGENIEKVRKDVEQLIGKKVFINIVEVRQPDLDAQLVAENIAAQLENRASYRRALKQAIGRAMKLGAKGIKVKAGGRLAGAEIARSETYHEGTIPLQTIRADIDYGFAEANTTYGKLGIKVWIYKGEILKGEASQARTARPERPERRRRQGGDRRREGQNGGNRRPRQNREGGKA